MFFDWTKMKYYKFHHIYNAWGSLIVSGGTSSYRFFSHWDVFQSRVASISGLSYDNIQQNIRKAFYRNKTLKNSFLGFMAPGGSNIDAEISISAFSSILDVIFKIELPHFLVSLTKIKEDFFYRNSNGKRTRNCLDCKFPGAWI